MTETNRFPALHGDQGDGTYTNPVLCSDYSDPDPVAVGGDFYMVASSFNCIPGLPVLHSRDLVNWSLISHALDWFPDDSYSHPRHGAGVWAPSIRHHDGKFWIYFASPDEGIYMIRATDPAGPWDQPVLVKSGKGMIDPCPFWDSDGQAYLVRGQAGSRCGGVNSLLTLHRMSPDGTQLLDEGRVVVDGHYHHPLIEGPKLYKRNGFYYIFAPAGGVKGGWQAVFRSRNIDGPYEDRIVLTQGDTDINGPHQGGYVETPHGEHWFIHFQDCGAQGRVVHLQPMNWRDDWPVIGRETSRDVFSPVINHPKPKSDYNGGPLRIESNDDFSAPALGRQWQWMSNPQPDWMELKQGRLRLTLQGTPSGDQNWWEAGNLLLQKPQDRCWSAVIRLRLYGKTPGDRAGLILTGGVSGAIVLEIEENGATVLKMLNKDSSSAGEPACLESLPWGMDEVCLRVDMIHGRAQFYYLSCDDVFTALGRPVQPKNSFWIGAKVGMIGLNRGMAPKGGYAEFESFKYHPLSPVEHDLPREVGTNAG